MKFIELELPGVVLIEPKVFEDTLRGGFFMENYNQRLFQDNGISFLWVQDNHSESKANVIRGLHFQAPPMAQDKLCRVIRGAAADIIVDLRSNSKTFGKNIVITLNEKNRRVLYVPKGFAHGFISLVDNTEFVYKTSEYYSPKDERGIHYSCVQLGNKYNMVINNRDEDLPSINDISFYF